MRQDADAAGRNRQGLAQGAAGRLAEHEGRLAALDQPTQAVQPHGRPGSPRNGGVDSRDHGPVQRVQEIEQVRAVEAAPDAELVLQADHLRIRRIDALRQGCDGAEVPDIALAGRSGGEVLSVMQGEATMIVPRQGLDQVRRIDRDAAPHLGQGGDVSDPHLVASRAGAPQPPV